MPYRRPPPRFQAGSLTPQDADNLNQLAQDLYRLVGGFSASPPLTLREDSTGIQIGFQPQGAGQPMTPGTLFPARISTTAGGTNGYSYGWIEQYLALDGTPSDMTGGRSGTQTVLPAVPLDKSTSVPINSPVWLTLSEKQKCYNFLLGGTGGSGSGGSSGQTVLFCQAVAKAGDPNIFDMIQVVPNKFNRPDTSGIPNPPWIGFPVAQPQSVWGWAMTGQDLVLTPTPDVYWAIDSGTTLNPALKGSRPLWYVFGPIVVQASCAANKFTSTLY